MRALALGRKKHYGSRSERGTQVAALFHTLIESANLLDLEPERYLREAAIRAIDNPGTVTFPRPSSQLTPVPPATILPVSATSHQMGHGEQLRIVSGSRSGRSVRG